jgi:uncharacterized protein
VQQPEVPSPVMITFPFPAWATSKDEVLKGSSSFEDVVKEAEDWLA